MKYLLGTDIGTSGTKTILTDLNRHLKDDMKALSALC